MVSARTGQGRKTDLKSNWESKCSVTLKVMFPQSDTQECTCTFTSLSNSGWGVAGKHGELDVVCEMKRNHRITGICVSQKVLTRQMRWTINYFTLKRCNDSGRPLLSISFDVDENDALFSTDWTLLQWCGFNMWTQWAARWKSDSRPDWLSLINWGASELHSRMEH